MLRVTVLLGCLLAASVTKAYQFEGYVNGDSPDDQFGSRVATLDFNADGYPDLAVSAPSNDAAGLSSGKVYLFFGGPSADLVPDLAFIGAASSFFGQSLASAGDFNADGFEDLLVGAPFYDIPASSAGAVYVFYGGPASDTAVDRLLTGQASNDYFGISVCGIGDFNNDGVDDIAIGAYRADWGVFSNAGKVYIYYGGLSPDLVADRVLVGTANGERFGYALAGGDFTGDNHADIAVGAYSYDATFLNQGRIYIFGGGITPDTIPDLAITGDSAGWKYGWSLSAGDINGDSSRDIVMGSDGISTDTVAHGEVLVFFGGIALDATADASYQLGRQQADYLGFAVAGGEIERDPYDDIVAGMPGNSDGGIDAGGAVVLEGGPSLAADTTIIGKSTGEEAGGAVGVWPWYTDSLTTAVVIGAPSYGSFTGRIHVYGKTALDPASCCALRGDVNHSGDIQISDLTYLVAFLFRGGPQPPCTKEGDLNADGDVKISDLTALVSYLFKGGAPPSQC